MRLLSFVAASLALLNGAEPGHAAPCQLSEPERATVAVVKDAETLELTDGTIVRLIGAKTPQVPLGWHGTEPWPLVAEASDTTRRLASGAEVELRFGGNRTRACVDALLAEESEARAAKRGIWNSWAYRVLDAADTEKLSRLSQSYQLVEGVVAETGEANGRVYLNFTKDWRTDFTIAIEPKDGPSFTAAGLDLRSLQGRHVRVEWRNGPMIVANHPEQIELLPEDKNETGPAGESSPNTGRLNR